MYTMINGKIHYNIPAEVFKRVILKSCGLAKVV